MSSLNKAILIGHLGQDPGVRTVGSGRQVASFSLATSESWKDKESGERKERTEWHRIVAWGKTAELVGHYLSKGRMVCVEGRMQTRKWQDKDGKDRWSTEVVADTVVFLPGGKKPQDGEGSEKTEVN